MSLTNYKSPVFFKPDKPTSVLKLEKQMSGMTYYSNDLADNLVVHKIQNYILQQTRGLYKNGQNTPNVSIKARLYDKMFSEYKTLVSRCHWSGTVPQKDLRFSTFTLISFIAAKRNKTCRKWPKDGINSTVVCISDFVFFVQFGRVFVWTVSRQFQMGHLIRGTSQWGL